MSTWDYVPLLGGDDRKLYKQQGGSPGKDSNFWFFGQWACSLAVFSKQKNKIFSFIKKGVGYGKKLTF